LSLLFSSVLLLIFIVDIDVIDFSRFWDCRTLLKIVGNLVDNPNNAQYRRVPTNNVSFQAKLGIHQGGVDCMETLGFRGVGEGDARVCARLFSAV
jgi:hypothetical protein